ncbi:unnamed protein product [Aureobasidium mustum]|uniref:Ig-like domain-containing protein n=1 Tax=Aureobasidium mustum TaxID=2773714 RepID=A0A9N8JPW7_9PEZI|nr:unnamed protein product [Aureobasidium mustum]
MFSQPGLWVLCLSLGLLQVISASPLVAPQPAATCSARDLAIVRRTVSDPVYFCKWWQAEYELSLYHMKIGSNQKQFSVHEVDTLCTCISPISKAPSSKHKRAEPTEISPVFSRSGTTAVCSLKVSREFTEPWHFCTFFNAYPRTTSPFRAYNAKELKTLCDCVLGKVVSSTSKKTSTNIHDQQKSIQISTRSSSSTRKSSSSTRPSSSTGKSSSGTRRSSSSSKSSSSTVKTSTSMTTKTPTSSKATSSSIRSSSLSKKTSSTQAASATSELSSSTRKASLTSSRATVASTPKSSSSHRISSSLISSKVSDSIILPSLIIQTTSSISTSLSLTRSPSSSALISSSIIKTPSTTQTSSSSDKSSTIDGLPTIAASVTLVTSSTASVSVNGNSSAPVTSLAVTPITATSSVPEFTTTSVSCDGLLCVSVGIGSSTTSTLGAIPTDDTDPAESPAQPTTTETSTIETSLPTTTTSLSPVCTPTPINTSCDDGAKFYLMASSGDLGVNGQYAINNAGTMEITADYTSADGFCLGSDNSLQWAIGIGGSGGPPAVKSTGTNPIEFATTGTSLSCAAVSNEDCTFTLQCNWESDYRTVVDGYNFNMLYLTDDTDDDYGGDNLSTPVNLIIQA